MSRAFDNLGNANFTLKETGFFCTSVLPESGILNKTHFGGCLEYVNPILLLRVRWQKVSLAEVYEYEAFSGLKLQSKLRMYSL